MKRTGAATSAAVLLTGLTLAACSQPTSGVTAAPAAVDAAVQQRVKNGCMEALKAQAAGNPKPGLRQPPKTKLSKVAFLGDIKQIELPGAVTGYELGMEFAFTVGRDDPRTGRKLCRINLVDSSVDWQPLK